MYVCICIFSFLTIFFITCWSKKVASIVDWRGTNQFDFFLIIQVNIPKSSFYKFLLQFLYMTHHYPFIIRATSNVTFVLIDKLRCCLHVSNFKKYIYNLISYLVLTSLMHVHTSIGLPSSLTVFLDFTFFKASSISFVLVLYLIHDHFFLSSPITLL